MKASHRVRLSLLAIAAALPLLGGQSALAQAGSAHPWLTPSRAGFNWTFVKPSADTKFVYVSNSSGNDANNGLSSASPVKTIEKGKSLLRHGYPDWLVLKSGDVWETGLGQWKKSGRSKTEPMVVWSYGTPSNGSAMWPPTGNRPILKGGTGFSVNGGGGSPPSIDNVYVMGIIFYCSQRDPNSPDYVGPGAGGQGVSWVWRGSNILFEDCMFKCFTDNLALTGFDSGLKDFRLRACVVIDSYRTSGHSQGIYATNVKGLLVEGCVFDHNGWHEKVPGAVPTIFNHNLYIQDKSNYGTTEDVTIRHNIIARGASHGLQCRPGGVVEGNFFIGNAIAMFTAFTPSVIRDNIVTEPRDISTDLPRGWGIDILSAPYTLVENNIVAHQWNVLGNGSGFRIADRDGVIVPYFNVEMRYNIVNDWPKGKSLNIDTPNLTSLIMVGNDFPKTGGPPSPTYLDPNRTAGIYNGYVLGGIPSTNAFLAEARKQSSGYWRPAYTSKAINYYIDKGFTIVP